MTRNPLITIYVNKIENGITFRIETGYYIKNLMCETIKLLSTKSKITKDESGENVPHLEIAKVILVQCILSTVIYDKIQVLHRFVPNKSFG